MASSKETLKGRNSFAEILFRISARVTRVRSIMAEAERDAEKQYYF